MSERKNSHHGVLTCRHTFMLRSCLCCCCHGILRVTVNLSLLHCTQARDSGRPEISASDRRTASACIPIMCQLLRMRSNCTVGKGPRGPLVLWFAPHLPSFPPWAYRQALPHTSSMTHLPPPHSNPTRRPSLPLRLCHWTLVVPLKTRPPINRQRLVPHSKGGGYWLNLIL